MNEPIMNIDDLISQYIDGELSGEAEAELHHRLSVSPEDRRRFREQIVLRGVARDQRLLERPSPALRSALFARLEREEGLAPAVAMAAASASADPSETSATSGTSARASNAPAASRSIADRPAVERRERRRRLVPMLLPFLVGIILSAAFWQFLERDDRGAELAINAVPDSAVVSAAPSASAGAMSLPSDSDAETAGDARGAGRVDESGTGASSDDGSAPGALAALPEGRVATTESSVSDGMGGGSGSVEPLAIAEYPERPAESFRPAEPRRRAFSSDGDAPAMGAPPSDQAMASDLSQIDGAAVEESESSRGEAARDERTQHEISLREALGRGPDRPASKSAAAPERAESPRMMGTRSADDEIGITSKRAPISRPAPTAVSAPDGEPEMASGTVAPPEVPMRTMSESPVTISAIETPPRGALLSTGLRQSMLVGMREREARPELALRLGGELAGGLHEIYGILGVTTFRESRTRSTEEFRTDPNLPATEYLYRSEQRASAANHTEFFAGAGYRINIIRVESWRAGVGTWGGYGERYLRAGAEIPVSYRIGENVRIEVTPSVQYVSAHGSGAATPTSSSTTPAPGQRSVVTEHSDVTDSELRPGIGVGVIVVID